MAEHDPWIDLAAATATSWAPIQTLYQVIPTLYTMVKKKLAEGTPKAFEAFTSKDKENFCKYVESLQKETIALRHKFDEEVPNPSPGLEVEAGDMIAAMTDMLNDGRALNPCNLFWVKNDPGGLLD